MACLHHSVLSDSLRETKAKLEQYLAVCLGASAAIESVTKSLEEESRWLKERQAETSKFGVKTSDIDELITELQVRQTDLLLSSYEIICVIILCRLIAVVLNS